ncbi:hypothetical protein LZ32DRAFT_307610 [Colletotrichum eremochloae]|nr:hypothetical protein LZ32DRAFT_307610 [Colletotrichum eremochloae]
MYPHCLQKPRGPGEPPGAIFGSHPCPDLSASNVFDIISLPSPRGLERVPSPTSLPQSEQPAHRIVSRHIPWPCFSPPPFRAIPIRFPYSETFPVQYSKPIKGLTSSRRRISSELGDQPPCSSLSQREEVVGVRGGPSLQGMSSVARQTDA